MVRRYAVAEERTDRRLLEQLAAEGRRQGHHANDLPRRREGSSRPAAAIDRDVSRTQEQRRADASLCRAARAACLGRTAPRIVQDERGAGLVREARDEASVRVGKGAGRRDAGDEEDAADRAAGTWSSMRRAA